MSATIPDCGCECAPNQDPCQPCGGGQFQIQCRSRSGTATLIGFSEFITPSVPPKKYREKRFSGTSKIWGYVSSPCSTLNTVCEWAYSGQDSYNDAGTLVQAGVAESMYASTGGVPVPGTDTIINSVGDMFCNLPFGVRTDNEVRTPTRRSFRRTAVDGSTGCVGQWNYAGDECRDDLVNEDTEEEAMGRVAATGDNAWTNWESCFGACSSKTLRGAGVFTFGFEEAEYRIRFAGTPGTTVMVELTFRRTPGTDYTIVVQDTATSLTFPTDPEEGWSSDTIPTGSGVETCLIGSRIYTP